MIQKIGMENLKGETEKAVRGAKNSPSVALFTDCRLTFLLVKRPTSSVAQTRRPDSGWEHFRLTDGSRNGR